MKFYGRQSSLIEWRAYLMTKVGREGSAVLPVEGDPHGDRFYFEVTLSDYERLVTSARWVEGGYCDRLEYVEGSILDEDD